MKRSKQNIKTEVVLKVGIFLVFLLTGLNAFAEGSKELYPNGTTGGRAKLRSSPAQTVSFPFANFNRHYIYAKPGEKITMASSAVGVNQGKVRLMTPGGQTLNYGTSGNTNYRIMNRSEELAGPNLPGQTVSGRYNAAVYNVTVEGIYAIDFIAPFGENDSNPANTTGRQLINANDNWNTQQNNDKLISAWDVSVVNAAGTGFIKGRVFTNILNLDIFNNWQERYAFYGKMYVLTKDGYTYHVNNNGSNGFAFEFFVNNKGFVDNDGNSIYKSVDHTNITGITKDPREADSETDITHKMFYSLPANDLPSSSQGSVPGGATWLKNTRLKPEATNLKIVGSEGTPGLVSRKGGTISFDANLIGKYSIKIISSDTPAKFPTRELTGWASPGSNKVFWDGKDGAGKSLPPGENDLLLTVRLQGAEVHFPYIDMEINPRGLILNLLTEDNSGIQSDIVYWDDSDVKNNNNPNAEHSNPVVATPQGQSSSVNGHKWGNYLTNNSDGTGSNTVNAGTGAYSFGNEKSMDTWTFILGEEQQSTSVISSLVSDLKINSIESDKKSVGTDGTVTYNVEVQNSDGSDEYSDAEGAGYAFNVPDGMEIISVTASSSCGGTDYSGKISDDGRHYNSLVDLPNGCTIVYEIVTKLKEMPVGPVEVEATILRPKDVTDPDATNPDPDIPPTDPYYECENNGDLSGGAAGNFITAYNCNNILGNSDVFYSNPSMLLEKEGNFNDENGNGLADVGETITYTLKVINTGDVALSDIVVSDPLLGGNLKMTPSGDDNNNALLDIDEVWIYTVSYKVTKEDIKNKGVYNLADVQGKNSTTGEDVTKVSSLDPDPLQPGMPGYDPNRPNHTFVPLKGKSLLITNPMIRQRVR